MKRMQSLVMICCLGLAAGGAAACSGSDEPVEEENPPPPPPPPPPAVCASIDNPDELPACFQTAMCEKLLSCGLGNLGDNSCDDVVPGYFVLGGIGFQEVADVKAAIDAGRTSFDVAAATACVQSIVDLTCLDLFLENSGFGSDCDQILQGLGAPGDDCASDFECDGGYCQGGNLGSGTTCEPLGTCVAFAADGASCVNAPCQHGSHCINNTCATGEQNAACYSDYECDPGLSCSLIALAAGNPPGTCQPIDYAAEGEACDNPGNSCTGRKLVCIPATLGAPTGTCEAPGAAGDKCIQICNNGLACVTPSDSPLGECTALASFADVGDTCDQDSDRIFGSPCGLYLTCQPGESNADPATCQNAGSEGDPCTGNINVSSGGPGFGDCNIGLFCSSEIVPSPQPVCTKPGANGEFCSSDSHCAEGTCGPTGRCGEPVACDISWN